MNKIKELIRTKLKDRIKELGLVDTGRMLDSIDVSIRETNDGFDISIMAVDYFEFVDAKYNISEPVLNSDEVTDLVVEETFKLLGDF